MEQIPDIVCLDDNKTYRHITMWGEPINRIRQRLKYRISSGKPLKARKIYKTWWLEVEGV